MAADDGQVVPPPRAGLCSLVKLAALVPLRGRRLFVKLFALAAVASTALFLVDSLALRPHLAAVILEDVNGVDSMDAWFTIMRGFLSDNKWLLVGAAGYLVADVVLGLAIKIATVFAAISACQHDHQSHTTLGSLLGRMKRNVGGPVVTVSFCYVLQQAYTAAAAVSAMLPFLLAELYSPEMIALLVPLLFGAFLFFVYLEVLCAVALVASAAEPGVRGAGAVRRAWRLMRGAKAQVALCMATTLVLGVGIPALYIRAMRWLPHSATTGVLRMDVALKFTVRAALDIFSVALGAAFYSLRTKGNDGVSRVKEE